VLAAACLLSYELVTGLLSHLPFATVPADDDLLGGMWAVVATVFVIRDSYRQSLATALSRMAATTASFVVCLLYLSVLPFHPWALAALVGLSTLLVTVAGRPQDAVTAGITTAVVLVVAAISPEHAWQQPVLRFADTVVGVAVGLAAAWIGPRLVT
jgi:uncharacterized membrane protein YgaE (UPF0421/DUF939 family)